MSNSCGRTSQNSTQSPNHGWLRYLSRASRTQPHVRGVVVLLEFGVHLDDPGHPLRHVGRNDCQRERTMRMWRMCHRCQAGAPRRGTRPILCRRMPGSPTAAVNSAPASSPILWRQRITRFDGPRPGVLFQRDGLPRRAAAVNVLDRRGGRLGRNFDGRSPPESRRQPPQRRRLGWLTIKFGTTNSVTHAGLNQSTQLGDSPMSVG